MPADVMRDEAFDIPVSVEIGAARRRHVIFGTVQAAQFLVDRWPQESRGSKYRTALKACMDAIDQRRAVGAARRAFVDAAREARLLSPGSPRAFGKRLS